MPLVRFKRKLPDLAECNGTVYVIKNSVNKKIYIGVTVNKLSSRLQGHKWSAINRRRTKFNKAMYEIGVEKFSIHALEFVDNLHTLSILERKYIKKYNSIKDGYNTAKGGGRMARCVGTKIKFKGMTFNSIQLLADYLEMDRGVVSRRLNKNMVLEAPIRSERWRNIDYEGKIFKSIRELAKFHEMNEGTVRHRLVNNIPLEDYTRGKPIEYKGMIFGSVKALSLYVNLPYGNTKMRLKKGIPLEYYKCAKEVSYQGDVYSSNKELSLKFNLSEALTRYRLKNNIPLDTPVGTSLLKRNGKNVEYRGKTYSSCYELSKHVNVSPTTILSRIERNVCINGSPENTGKKGYYTAKFIGNAS